MILDGLLIFCGTVSSDNAIAGQLVTALGATLATNVIDIAPTVIGGNQPPDMGQGGMLDVGVSIMQALTSAGAATISFQLVQADDPAMSTNIEVVAQTPAYAYTVFSQGRIITLAWTPAEPLKPRRYVSMQVVIAGAVLTNATGQFFSYVPQAVISNMNRHFKSGYSIT